MKKSEIRSSSKIHRYFELSSIIYSDLEQTKKLAYRPFSLLGYVKSDPNLEKVVG